VQLPTKYQLVINLKAAKALGLQVPDKLTSYEEMTLSLARAAHAVAAALPANRWNFVRYVREHPQGVVHGTLLGRNFESALLLISLCALHVALQ
jgi:hypothetical protein